MVEFRGIEPLTDLIAASDALSHVWSFTQPAHDCPARIGDGSTSFDDNELKHELELITVRCFFDVMQQLHIYSRNGNANLQLKRREAQA